MLFVSNMKKLCLSLSLCFGFLTAAAQKEALTVADLQVQVPGKTTVEKWQKSNSKAAFEHPVHYYAFQRGDQMLVSIDGGKDKSTYTLIIREYTSGSTVYNGSVTARGKDINIPVPAKAVYSFTLKSTTPEDKDCRLILRRVPAAAEFRHFNPNVSWQTRYDTTWTTVSEKVTVKGELQPEQLVDKTFRVYSRTNIGNSNRSYVRFKLPAHTEHWVYWLGVGQESVEQLKQMTQSFSRGAATVTAPFSPVAAFGLGLLPNLPQVNASGNITYYFMNKTSAEKFVKDEAGWKNYPFAQGSGIISDYGKVPLNATPKTDDGYLYVCFENSNTLTGLDVNLKIIAFVSQPRTETRSLRKPQAITKVQVPVLAD